MLNLEAVQQQIAEFRTYRVRQQEEREVKLRRALDVFAASGNVDPSVLSRLTSERLIGEPLEPAASRKNQPLRPTPVTVAATDGSQIYPDRHVEPTCYLLNVSRVAFQYGTHEAPVLGASPRLYFRGQHLDWLGDMDIEIADREMVSALRDSLEIAELFEVAKQARVEGRPILALADGTMIRWMLRSMRNRDVEKKLLDEYVDTLRAFQEHGIPLCSYISMPATREVANLLACWGVDALGEAEGFMEDVKDRALFERTLGVGQRSATFRSRSLVLNEYPEEHRICFFFVKVKGKGGTTEIARIEYPAWMNERQEWIDLAHAVVVSEAEKGSGYPTILSEAHEHAVVRGVERDIFYRMIEQEMIREGLPVQASFKKASKEHHGG